MSEPGEKANNFALIAASSIGLIALVGMIVAMFFETPNEGAREITAALAAIVGMVTSGLIFMIKRPQSSSERTHSDYQEEV